MDFKEPFSKKYSVLIAIILTIAGYISLRVGGLSVRQLPPNIAEVAGYIVPLIFLIVVRFLFNIKDNNSLTKVYDPSQPKHIKRFFAVLLIGLIGFSLSLFLTISGDLVRYFGKPFVSNFGSVLTQLVLLNLCIGLFE